MQVPTVIFYKAHWLTYALAKILVQINHMGLPNLVTGKELMPEFIQGNCTPKNLCDAVGKILRLAEQNPAAYTALQNSLGMELDKVFGVG